MESPRQRQRHPVKQPKQDDDPLPTSAEKKSTVSADASVKSKKKKTSARTAKSLPKKPATANTAGPPESASSNQKKTTSAQRPEKPAASVSPKKKKKDPQQPPKLSLPLPSRRDALSNSNDATPLLNGGAMFPDLTDASFIPAAAALMAIQASQVRSLN